MAYQTLFQGTNNLHKDHGVRIDREDFAAGYTLFAFDLSGPTVLDRPSQLGQPHRLRRVGFHAGNHQIQTRRSRLWALTWKPRNYFAASSRTTSSAKLSEGFYLGTNCSGRSWKIFPSHSSSTRIPVEDRGNTGWLSTSRVRITGNFSILTDTLQNVWPWPKSLTSFLLWTSKTGSVTRQKVQGDFSTVCGQFCLFSLHHRCRGYAICAR